MPPDTAHPTPPLARDVRGGLLFSGSDLGLDSPNGVMAPGQRWLVWMHGVCGAVGGREPGSRPGPQGLTGALCCHGQREVEATLSAGWPVARDAVTCIACGFWLRLPAAGWALLLQVWQASGTCGWAPGWVTCSRAPSPSGGREAVTASPRPPQSGCPTPEMRHVNVLVE